MIGRQTGGGEGAKQGKGGWKLQASSLVPRSSGLAKAEPRVSSQMQYDGKPSGFSQAPLNAFEYRKSVQKISAHTGMGSVLCVPKLPSAGAVAPTVVSLSSSTLPHSELIHKPKSRCSRPGSSQI